MKLPKRAKKKADSAQGKIGLFGFHVQAIA